MVGRYPTNYLIRRGPLRQRNSFALRPYTVSAAVSRGCPVLPGRFPRVTHPCATPWRTRAFDLHVLGMPPAFVLSQDQSLMFIPSPGSHPGKVTRNLGPSHIWSHHQIEMRHLHDRPTPEPQSLSPKTGRPGPPPAHPFLYLSTLSNSQPPSTRDSERREGPKTLANSPTASNEGTRLIRPGASARQPSSCSPTHPPVAGWIAQMVSKS